MLKYIKKRTSRTIVKVLTCPEFIDENVIHVTAIIEKGKVYVSQFVLSTNYPKDVFFSVGGIISSAKPQRMASQGETVDLIIYALRAAKLKDVRVGTVFI